MKYWFLNSTGTVMSDVEILDVYYLNWSEEIIEVEGFAADLSPDRCIGEFVVIYNAYEVDADDRI